MDAEGFNIAGRIQGLGEAGGLRISGSVYEEISSKLSLDYEPLGEQSLKNIEEAVFASPREVDLRPLGGE